MKEIEVAGIKYEIVSNLGYQHSSGVYAKMVQTPTGEKMVVKEFGKWRFWTVEDRISVAKKMLAFFGSGSI